MAASALNVVPIASNGIREEDIRFDGVVARFGEPT